MPEVTAPPIAPPTILSSYAQGQSGDIEGLTTSLQSATNPIEAFACLAAYFAGKQETVMSEKLAEYEAKFTEYKECLEHSKQAHEGKAGAAAKDGCSSSKDYVATEEYASFDDYMDEITDDQYSDKMDKNDDSKHNEDEWQSFADVLNEQKDILSTELNKLSTEMDMAVTDSSEAEQMAANAIKKAIDLLTTQGKTSGG